MYNSEHILPEKSAVDEMFNKELQDIYRKADIHITKQIKKAEQLMRTVKDV